MTARVLILALGGTIASTPARPGRRGAAIPTLSGAELVAAVPELAEAAEAEVRTVRQVPSCEVTPADLCQVFVEATRWFAGGGTGAVVVQGTDTLEESAYLLDLLHSGDEPIVVTGAMRTPDTPGADGPANLLAAVQVAASPDARGCGVLAVLGDEIHAAAFVRKGHASSPGAFVSPGAGPLGRVSEGRVIIDLTPAHRTPTVAVPPDAPWPCVPILRVAMDTRPAEVEALGGIADGLVVEGVGGGHAPSLLVGPLTELAARIPVVLASRTGAGGTLTRSYGYPGSEIDLLARGLESAGPRDALRARLWLSARLAAAGR